ncbi:MAG: hypothetical protein IJH47_00650 [Oscillospiraceae bacterium]|nr:hypothetical protein [Oscillospiraceae bacterium]
MDFPIQLVFVWLFIVLAIVIGTRKAAAKQQQKKGAAPVRRAPAVTRRNAHDDDCAYGEVNHEYSHQDDRRLQQLEGYLKAGLIDQMEYREMVARDRGQSQYDDR